MHRNKKENDPNQGKWIGVGGHVEEGEDIISSMKREVFEETQLTLGSYTYHGLILFESDIFENEEMHLFSCKDFIGDFVQSNEGTLKWIDIDMIFSLNLWEGDMIFLKLMLKESPFFKLQLIYEKDQLKQFDIIYPNNIK